MLCARADLARMIEVTPVGPIRKLKLARSLPAGLRYYTAAYLVDGLMVDTGCAHTVAELVGAVEEWPVHTVVNTHSHEDHIAGNAALQARRGARVLAHAAALPVLADPRKLQLEPWYRRLVWGYPAPSHGHAIAETVETEHHRFRVIPSPGHSPDHVCLFEPDQGWLFVGDAFVGGKDRGLRGESNIWQVLASLKRLRALDAAVMLPGSGTIHHPPSAALDEKIAYLEELGGRVLDLHHRGLEEEAIQLRLLGRDSLFMRLTWGDFCGANLVRSFIANRPAPSTETGP